MPLHRPGMSLQALDDQSRAPAVQKPGKEPRIPKRIRQACDLLATGECKTIKAAAERVKMSREHLGRMLNRSHVQAFIAQQSRRTIAQGILRASARVIELVDAASEHVSLDAAKHVLAIEGIRPPDNSQPLVNIAISPGYVVKLRHATEEFEGTTLTAHQRQTEAKPLIDNASVSQSVPLAIGQTERVRRNDADEGGGS